MNQSPRIRGALQFSSLAVCETAVAINNLELHVEAGNGGVIPWEWINAPRWGAQREKSPKAESRGTFILVGCSLYSTITDTYTLPYIYIQVLSNSEISYPKPPLSYSSCLLKYFKCLLSRAHKFKGKRNGGRVSEEERDNDEDNVPRAREEDLIPEAKQSRRSERNDNQKTTCFDK